MKFKGFKVGLIFLVFSILLTLTFVGPVFIPMFAEGIGKSINDLFNLENISGTTFYTCVTICLLCFAFYVLTLIKCKQNSLISLTIFFVSIFIFLNAALFYYNIRFPDSHIDGQQAFDSIDKPVKTCLLYLVFGLGHDFFMNKYSNINNSKSHN